MEPGEKGWITPRRCRPDAAIDEALVAGSNPLSVNLDERGGGSDG